MVYLLQACSVIYTYLSITHWHGFYSSVIRFISSHLNNIQTSQLLYGLKLLNIQFIPHVRKQHYCITNNNHLVSIFFFANEEYKWEKKRTFCILKTHTFMSPDMVKCNGNEKSGHIIYLFCCKWDIFSGETLIEIPASSEVIVLVCFLSVNHIRQRVIGKPCGNLWDLHLVL